MIVTGSAGERNRANCSTVVPMPRNIVFTPWTSSVARIPIRRLLGAFTRARALNASSRDFVMCALAPP